jgi:hypothetical protein
MPVLSDGTFAPAYLGIISSNERGAKATSLLMSNSDLHIGYVVAAHAPGSRGYLTETEWTYDIVSEVSQGTGMRTTQTYYRARAGFGLGGSINDFTSQTIHTPKGWVPGQFLTPELRKQASRVVFLCENGIAQKPIIVGFARHLDNPNYQNAKLGHNYIFNFNGISTTISKDGEYAITFTGGILDANSNTYLKPPEATTGTFLKFLKDGSWTVDDAKGESIKLDKPGKALNAVARAINVTTTEKDYNLKTKGKATVQATGNAVFNSGKKIYIGKEGATDPLVLGNKLASALKALVDIISLPVLGQAGPFSCVSAIAAPLKAWGAMYATQNVSPFLSKKGYVE